MILINDVAVVRPYQLDVSFNDGTVRRVDAAPLLWGPLFEPLKDPAYFSQARFDAEIGTVAWTNDADFAPAYLHQHSVIVAQ
jgi:hypothetical protein